MNKKIRNLKKIEKSGKNWKIYFEKNGKCNKGLSPKIPAQSLLTVRDGMGILWSFWL